MKTRSGTLPKPTVPKLTGGPNPAPSKRLARQRRPRWVVAGVMLLAFAVLANVYLFQSSGQRVAVVRLARDVAVGHKIVQADLDVVRVATGSTVPVVPERQLGEVVGRRAAVGLRKGTLLAASQLATQQSPPPGQALVTVPLKASAIPPGLAPGWRVRVVFTPSGQEQGAGARPGQEQVGVARDVSGVVDQVEGPDAEGAMTVALLVADADSSRVARQAAAGLVVLVVTEMRG
ncbi:SAF domain-containing protein [Spirillospora sp. CA-108201]